MLARFSIKVFCTLFAVLLLTGCGQSNEPITVSEPLPVRPLQPEGFPVAPMPAADTAPGASFFAVAPNFQSLEEFAYAHSLVMRGSADSDFTEMAERVNFASLETLYIPTGLPEPYRLVNIEVHEEHVNVWFLPEEVTAETWTDALVNFRYFLLQVTRWTDDDLETWGLETPLSGIMRQHDFGEEALIDGKYHFCDRTNTFSWAYGSNLFTLRMPRPPADSRDAFVHGAGIIGFEGDSVDSMLAFTDFTAIDLADENAISAFIAYRQNQN